MLFLLMQMMIRKREKAPRRVSNISEIIIETENLSLGLFRC